MVKGNQYKVVMFPWLAYGHISPFLELAKKLSQRDFVIYLCSTSAALSPVKEKLTGLSSEISTSINLLELQLNNTYLPPHQHTTNGLPIHLMTTLKAAFESTRLDFTEILKTLKPDLLIYDIHPSWPSLVAAELNIPAIEFNSSSTTMMAMMWYGLLKFPLGFAFPFHSSIHHHDYELTRIEREKIAMPVEKIEHKDGKNISISKDTVLVKGFKDIEGKFSDYVTSLTGRRIVFLGSLVQEPTTFDDNLFNNSKLMKWLKGKEKRSTIFISFGSEYFLCNEDLVEIAHGLEASKVNFIWPLRFAKEDVELEDVLPKGFLDRVGNRGRVFKGWAPQGNILKHPSIGGFLSHCGWSSIMESMKCGVPIIAIPIQFDQPMNSRLIVNEVGMAMEVVRDSEGNLHRDKVASVINQVVLDERGEHIRKKTYHMKEFIRSKEDEQIDQAVKELENLVLSFKFN